MRTFIRTFTLPTAAGSVTGRSVATTAGLAVGGVLLLAGTASAHVSVQPGTAVQGSYSEVAIHVPNEEDTATTTQVQLYLPTDHPIASVSLASIPGWTATVQKTKLAKPLTTDDGQVTEAVSEITWTGGAIRPGEFQDFAVSLGPLPTDTASLTFKALQTYSDGKVVRWIQPSVEGRPEPANPAPVLKLTATSPAAGAAAGSSSESAKAVTVTAQGAKSSSSDTTARVLAGVGLLVGLLGVGFGFLGWRRGSAPTGDHGE